MGETSNQVGKVKLATPALIDKTMNCLRSWQRNPKMVHECPSCGAAGVQIIDGSTRPFADWYVFRCKACGLDDALSIPMTSHRPLL